jgi:2-aminoadipate transaminase
VQAKQGTDLHSSTFDQMLAYEVGRGGFIDRHVHRIREVYGQRRTIMIRALEQAFPDPSAGVRWTRPQGGLFLWVTLPEHMNAADVLIEAVREKVAFVPGAPFFPGGGGHNTIRLNFSNANEQQIVEGIARLGRVVTRALEAQPVSA